MAASLSKTQLVGWRKFYASAKYWTTALPVWALYQNSLRSSAKYIFSSTPISPKWNVRRGDLGEKALSSSSCKHSSRSNAFETRLSTMVENRPTCPKKMTETRSFDRTDSAIGPESWFNASSVAFHQRFGCCSDQPGCCEDVVFPIEDVAKIRSNKLNRRCPGINPEIHSNPAPAEIHGT